MSRSSGRGMHANCPGLPWVLSNREDDEAEEANRRGPVSGIPPGCWSVGSRAAGSSIISISNQKTQPLLDLAQICFAKHLILLTKQASPRRRNMALLSHVIHLFRVVPSRYPRTHRLLESCPGGPQRSPSPGLQLIRSYQSDIQAHTYTKQEQRWMGEQPAFLNHVVPRDYSDTIDTCL